MPKSPNVRIPRVSLTLFEAASHKLAAYSTSLKRILAHHHVTLVPGAPATVDGLLEIGPDVVPQVALDRLLWPETAGAVPPQHVLLVETTGGNVGFAVDFVAQVVSVPETVLLPVPGLVQRNVEPYVLAIAHVDNERVPVLDLTRVPTPEQRREIAEWLRTHLS